MLNQTLQRKIDDVSLKQLLHAITKRCQFVKDDIEKRHHRKLGRHLDNERQEAVKKKWVINTSQRKLTNDEISLLRNGLNFAITPRYIPTKEILASVEEGISSLQEDEKDDVRGKVCCILRQAKAPVHQNLTRGEKKALRDLKMDKSILITKADKGNSVVVMDRTEYKEQVKEMLNDQNVYNKITDKRRNPTSKTEAELQRILLQLKKSGHLAEPLYWKLRPFDSCPASFYGLPKVHKVTLIPNQNHFTNEKETCTTIPLRPINSNIGSPTYELSKYLASILKRLYQENRYSIKNAKDFVDFIKTQQIEADEIIVSFDVVSLFTSIPIRLAMDVVKRKLQETEVWKAYTDLSENEVLNLLTFVLNNNYFKFEGTYYHQIEGCAMGSPVSAVIAELVMQEIETIAINSSPVAIRWWRRYVDDSNSCLKRRDVDQFHAHLNTINPNIQFTIETASVTKQRETISFLDTKISVLEDRRIEIEVHRKETHTNKYLAFKSYNPSQSKRAVVKTLLDRAKAIPSSDCGQQEEKDRVLLDLQVNGYTTRFIENTCKPRKKLPAKDTPRGFTCIPYIKGTSEQIKRDLEKAGVRTAYRPMATLGDVFCKPKDRPQNSQIKGIVYKFKCQSCSFTYVGESKRSWSSRWAEHKPGVRRNNESAIKDHAEKTGHDVFSTDVNILEKRIGNYHKRVFLEAVHSIQDKDAINEHKQVPRIYIPLLKSLEN